MSLDALLVYSTPRLMLLLLALARLGGLALVGPLFGSQILPVRVRVIVTFGLAVALQPVLSLEQGAALAESLTALGLVTMLIGEASIGFAIGLIAQFTFSGVQMAGQLAAYQMGLGLANVIDPRTEQQLTALAQWQNLLALLVFLAVDGHHMLVRATAKTYDIVPAGMGALTVDSIGVVLTLAASVFVIAVKVAAPVLVVLVLTNAAMGVLGRMVPQLNIFLVGFPINICAGLVILMASQPFVVRLLVTSFGEVEPSLLSVMEALD